MITTLTQSVLSLSRHNDLPSLITRPDLFIQKTRPHFLSTSSYIQYTGCPSRQISSSNSSLVRNKSSFSCEWETRKRKSSLSCSAGTGDSFHECSINISATEKATDTNKHVEINLRFELRIWLSMYGTNRNLPTSQNRESESAVA